MAYRPPHHVWRRKYNQNNTGLMPSNCRAYVLQRITKATIIESAWSRGLHSSSCFEVSINFRGCKYNARRSKMATECYIASL